MITSLSLARAGIEDATPCPRTRGTRTALGGAIVLVPIIKLPFGSMQRGAAESPSRRPVGAPPLMSST